MGFERLLRPFREARVLYEDAGLLVVDKPFGLPVHGGNVADGDDLVTRLAARASALGADGYLGVHQRLDKETSGVLLFTRRREANAAIADEMEARRVRRTYVAGVEASAASRLGPAFRLEHRLLPVKGGPTRVVHQGGQLARTTGRLLERVGDRALLELSPETGRKHQLRAQLARVGAPVAGDSVYGGAPFDRLLLHALTLELPGSGQRFQSPLPREFSSWLAGRDIELGSGAELAAVLEDAACRRWPLRDRTQAFRWVNGAGDGAPGIIVDVYGDFAVLDVSSDAAAERSAEIAALLIDAGALGVYLKRRVRGDVRRADLDRQAPEAPIAGRAAPPELEVGEGPWRFGVRLDHGLSTGLFLDQRDNRALVHALGGGGRVLNLFAYTCSFSVAAASAGAETTSVDLSATALDQGRRNFERNGLAARGHRFVREDVTAWLPRAARRGERFDLIVLDPPSFATMGKRTFRVASDYADVAAAALRLLSPGGRLLAVTNHRKTRPSDLRRVLHTAARAAGRELEQLKDLPSPLDCPPDAGGPSPSKSALLTVV